MTTEQVEQTQLRPFHETIVEAARSFPLEDIPCLLKLIGMTKIPRNHDEIMSAFERRWPRASFELEYIGVRKILLAQKQAAEAKADDAKKSVNLHDKKERALMIVIEKIIAIIQNWRQPSPQARDKVTEVFKLSGAAKRIHSAEDERDFQNAIVGLQ